MFPDPRKMPKYLKDHNNSAESKQAEGLAPTDLAVSEISQTDEVNKVDPTDHGGSNDPKPRPSETSVSRQKRLVLFNILK